MSHIVNILKVNHSRIQQENGSYLVQSQSSLKLSHLVPSLECRKWFHPCAFSKQNQKPDCLIYHVLIHIYMLTFLCKFSYFLTTVLWDG